MWDAVAVAWTSPEAASATPSGGTAAPEWVDSYEEPSVVVVSDSCDVSYCPLCVPTGEANVGSASVVLAAVSLAPHCGADDTEACY